jgi:hypothetical protein
MKSSQEMTGEILELESKINSLNEQIADLEEKKASAEQEHTKLIQQNLSNEKPSHGPGLGDAFAKSLEHALHADALRKAKLDLEARLNQAQSELSVVRLYEITVQAFKEKESNFLHNVQRIEKSISALNKNLDALAETIDIFMQETSNPLDAVESLLKNPMLAGLSFKGFIDGEIKQAKPDENDDFLQAIGRKYLELANRLPRLKDISDSWTLLSDRLDNQARQAQGLIPSSLKYIPAAPVKPKPELETGTTIRIPIKPPPKKLSWGEKKARKARKAAALFR